VFGPTGTIRNQTRIKLVRSPTARSYYVWSYQLNDGKCSSEASK